MPFPAHSNNHEAAALEFIPRIRRSAYSEIFGVYLLHSAWANYTLSFSEETKQSYRTPRRFHSSSNNTPFWLPVEAHKTGYT